MERFDANSRSSILEKCQQSPLDIIIVGGGITGAGILLDASRRGLRVGLFEQGDFASGTSSVSSKLVHGGLRYLETFDLGLIFESVRERKRLLKMAPSLVKPLEFMIPVYDGQRRGLYTIFLGTWIYYFLAFFHNIGRPKLNRPEITLTLESELRKQNLQGSVRYFDAGTIDSRLTLSAIKTAWELGGMACNHAKVVEYVREKNRIAGVVVEDQLSGKRHRVFSKWVINAVGPWTDSVRKKIVENSQDVARLTKGIHILVEGNPFSIQRAMLMLSPIDGRVVFLIPWCGHTLIGTTDDDFKGIPEQARVEKEDMQYLIRTAEYYFPSIRITNDLIVSTYVGLRCLKHKTNMHPSDVSREHIMFSDQPGLLTIAGGKLTTFISMGEEVLDWLISRETAWKHRSKTEISTLQQVMPLEALKNPSEEAFEQLIEHEMAATVRDLLQYRTLSYYLSKDHGASLIESASRAIRMKLGCSEEEIQRQIDEYKTEIAKQNV